MCCSHVDFITINRVIHGQGEESVCYDINLYRILHDKSGVVLDNERVKAAARVLKSTTLHS